ncbi:hypothetical protein EQZ23_10600 [Sphingomonas sp. UV9]|nr:hypothetical protein EQZ23_10600 [Sphingomonas sp. UV9]
MAKADRFCEILARQGEVGRFSGSEGEVTEREFIASRPLRQLRCHLPLAGEDLARDRKKGRKRTRRPLPF